MTATVLYMAVMVGGALAVYGAISLFLRGIE